MVKSRGGQKGHQGITLQQVSSPDKIERCSPTFCGVCKNDLDSTQGVIISKRQEFDIPPIHPIVTEYQQISIRCGCGHNNKGNYPEHIKSPVQIGSNMQSFLIYLSVVQLIPFKRLAILCKDLFNFPLCKPSIENILNRAYKKAAPLYQDIIKIIKRCLWVGTDETGKRVEGKRWWEWVWVWQTSIASFYVISPSRGYQVVKEHFGEDYQGILIHDCWSAHNNTVAKTGHQQCHAHLQRDLKFLIETYNSK